jgi:hypothetical protein
VNYRAQVLALQRRRDEEIRGVKARHPSLSIKDIAVLVHCSHETVYRVLGEHGRGSIGPEPS